MYTENDKDYHLLWIEPHDPAYNTKDSIQEIKYSNNNPILGSRDYYTYSGLTKVKTRCLFDRISAQELERMSVPKDKIKFIKSITNINSLPEIQKIVPPDIYESLECLASGFHVQDILEDMERQRRELLDFLNEKVLIPAEECKKLDDDMRESIRNTRDRLESKNTLKEILDFYFDALKAKRGKQLSKKFHEVGLKSFEDFEEEIKKKFELYNPANI